MKEDKYQFDYKPATNRFVTSTFREDSFAPDQVGVDWLSPHEREEEERETVMGSVMKRIQRRKEELDWSVKRKSGRYREQITGKPGHRTKEG